MASAAFCTPVDTRVSYARELWFTMHHSYRPDLAAMPLEAYYDDSGTDATSRTTVIGGPVMSEQAFVEFEEKWSLLLESYDIPHPLHMKDFFQKGKHGGLPTNVKRELFGKVAKLINKFKFFSISVGVSQVDFNAAIEGKIRQKLIGPYAFAFFNAVITNRKICSQSTLYKKRTISYLLDHGSAGKSQLLAAHGVIANLEQSQGGFRNIGSMAFDTDDRVSALQAADVIAWSARRRANGMLEEEFSPLNEALSEPYHSHTTITKNEIKFISKPILNWVYSKGEMPSLRNIVTWS